MKQAVKRQSSEDNRPVTISLKVVFHFIVVLAICVCSSSVTTLKLTFHFDVTCGSLVAVDVFSKIPTSCLHFNHSDSAICEHENKYASRLVVKYKKLNVNI